VKKGSTNAGDFGDDDEEDDVGFVHGKKKNMIAFLPAQGEILVPTLECFLICGVRVLPMRANSYLPLVIGLAVVRLYLNCGSVCSKGY
jgi:hypothetical protein